MVNKPRQKMFVIKRDGRKEDVHFDKITSRIQKLCYGLNMDYVDPVSITIKVVNGLYAGVTTTELDTIAAETAAAKMVDHPDYGTLAARIEISNLHKETKKQFSEVIEELYNNFDAQLKKKVALISEQHYTFIMKNASSLNSCIIYDRDFSFNYFGFKLLEQSYLKQVNGKIVERPQHMFMRAAVGIHIGDVDSAIETYNLLSERYYVHSSTTLHSACFPTPQMSASFAMLMPSDSIEGIFTCISNCGQISKYAGGIGVGVQNIRAKGSYIAGTNGTSNGLVPMLRVFDGMAAVTEQLGLRRNAEIAIYLEPWHADIFEFLNLGKPTGKEELRARNLSYGLWVPDIFMKRVEADGKWSLMCPNGCPGLVDAWGEEFDKIYESYEAQGKFVKQVQAQELWRTIVVSHLECESPFIMYKDHCNAKSNQSHCGTLTNANHTTEGLALTIPGEIAAFTQASIAVEMFVSLDRKSFDFAKLKAVAKVITKNLDKMIDTNFYALDETKVSNLRHRPVGIGIQGLADALILLRTPFDSEEAVLLNKQIFETVYYAALEASSELAEVLGTYPSYKDSPMSCGVLQYDMWQVQPTGMWDWAGLKQKIAKSGVRNALVTAQMPTTELSRILGNNDSTEPYKSNVFTHSVSSGEFQVVNHHLLRDLTELELWSDDVKSKIITGEGSVQNIPEIPKELKEIYKTVWEIKQKVVMSMAVDRGAFLDQSQSINVYMDRPTYNSLNSMHFFGWRNGLKTGIYHLKTPSSKSLKVADKSDVVVVDHEELGSIGQKEEAEEERNVAGMVCSLSNPEGCEMCGA